MPATSSKKPAPKKPTPRKPVAKKQPAPPSSPAPEPRLEVSEEWARFVTEDAPLASLTPHPRNYQQHPQDELEHIKASLRDHGFFRPIVVARDNTILAGHGVTEAARQLGMERVPVVRKDYDPFEPRALRLVIADNEIRHLAARDDRTLTAILKELAEADALMGTGYDDMMLANLMMVTRPPDQIEKQDASAEWVSMPEYDEKGETRLSIVVNFASEDDRVEFCDRLGLDAKTIPTEGARKSIWWPPRERRFDDNTSIRFADWGPPKRGEVERDERAAS